jgi:hypothetical protein
VGSWDKQFSVTGFEELLAEVESDPRMALERVRGWVSGHLSSWKPELKHFHSSWGWAEGYEGRAGTSTSLLSVFVIPEPGHERAALSFTRSGLEVVRNAELPKSIHLEIRNGTCVRDVVWVECSLRVLADGDGVCSLLEVLAQ